jgi:hypothetical protein
VPSFLSLEDAFLDDWEMLRNSEGGMKYVVVASRVAYGFRCDSRIVRELVILRLLLYPLLLIPCKHTTGYPHSFPALHLLRGLHQRRRCLYLP